jgi:DNA-binding HxlR family transcriptional regulator
MATYGQFCPVSKAADVLCQRWAMLVVREMLLGSVRFRELQRGLPGGPPATLSKRIKELTTAGVVRRQATEDGIAYELTEAGWELYPIVEAMGRWGQRWVRSTYDDGELDAEMLLWDVRRFLDPAGLGVDSAVIELALRVDAPARHRRFWVTVDPGEVDVCMVDPERPVDVVLDAHLRTLTEIWMGDRDFPAAVASGEVVLRGPAGLTRRIPAWLGQHPVLAPIGPAERSSA